LLALSHTARASSLPTVNRSVLIPLIAFAAALLCVGTTGAAPSPQTSGIASPDGRIAVDFYLNDAGAPRYTIRREGQLVLRESRLGLVRDDADFTRGLQLLAASETQPVQNRYEILTAISNIQRRTTSAFELALSVLFTSGIQHYAEIPEGMAKAPGYVRDFLKHVPAIWDDTKFLDGYPGKFVILARKGGSHWYVAGINSEATAKTLTLNLGELSPRSAGTLIADGDGGNLSFRQETVHPASDQTLKVTLPPQGGFVLVFE